MMSSMTPPWRRTLQAYIGPKRIVEPAGFGYWERRMIEDVRVAFESIDRDALRVAESFGRPGFAAACGLPREEDATERLLMQADDRLAFLFPPAARALVIADCRSREPLGAILNGMTFVPPAARGQGVGAELVWLSEAAGLGLLMPSHFSLDGFHGRLGAHRRHVERAVKAGLHVPADVLDAYETGPDGHLRLAEPWSADDHRRWAAGSRRLGLLAEDGNRVGGDWMDADWMDKCREDRAGNAPGEYRSDNCLNPGSGRLQGRPEPELAGVTPA